MPTLNKSKCYVTPQLEKELGQVPDYTLDDIYELFVGILGEDHRLTAEYTETIRSTNLVNGTYKLHDRLNVHTCDEKQGTEVKKALNIIVHILKSGDLKRDEQVTLATKALEDILYCTPGYLNRLLALVRGFTQKTPKNIDDLLSRIRYEIVDRAANKTVNVQRYNPETRKKEYVNVRDGNQVHAWNDFFKIANKEHYGVLEVNSKDKNTGEKMISSALVRKALATEFQNEYQFVTLPQKSIEQMKSTLFSMGYTGLKDDNKHYESLDYKLYIEFINDILKPATEFPINQLLIANANKLFIDVNWSFIEKKLCEKLIKDDYIEFNPQERKLVDCLLGAEPTFEAFKKQLNACSTEFIKLFNTLEFFQMGLDWISPWAFDKKYTLVEFYLKKLTENKQEPPDSLDMPPELLDDAIIEFLKLDHYDLSFYTHTDPQKNTAVMRTIQDNNLSLLKKYLDAFISLQDNEQDVGPALFALIDHFIRTLERSSLEIFSVWVDMIKALTPENKFIFLMQTCALGQNILILIMEMNRSELLEPLSQNLDEQLDLEQKIKILSLIKLNAAGKPDLQVINDDLFSFFLTKKTGLFDALLLDYCKEPLTQQQSLLRQIPGHSSDNSLRFILEKKPDLFVNAIDTLNKADAEFEQKLNAHDSNGQTLLMRSLELEQEDAFEALLKHGASVNLRDKEGNNALDRADEAPQEYVELLLLGASLLSKEEQQEFLGKGFSSHVKRHDTNNPLLDFALERGLAHFKPGDTVLISASRIGSPFFVEQLLQLTIDINAVNETGESALITAIQNRHYAIAVQLISHGADITIRNQSGLNALDVLTKVNPLLSLPIAQALLFKAAQLDLEEQKKFLQKQGNQAVVYDNIFAYTLKKTRFFSKLIEQIKNENKGTIPQTILEATNQGDNLLMTAIQRGNNDVIELLLKNGIALTTTNKDGKTVFELFIEMDRPLEALLISEKEIKAALQTAASKEHTELFKKVVDIIFEKSPDFPCSYLELIRKNDEFLAIVLDQLNSKRNRFQKEKTMIFAFQRENHLERYKLLRPGDTTLIAASRIDVSAFFKPVTPQATGFNEPVCFGDFFEPSADINAVNDAGETAVIAAVQSKQYANAAELITHKANLTLRNSNGLNVLDVLAIDNPELSEPIAKSLLFKATQLNLAVQKELLQKQGEFDNVLAFILEKTPFFPQLIEQVQKENKGSIPKYMLEVKNQGDNLLMTALKGKNDKVVELLIKNKIELTTENSEGKTVFELALELRTPFDALIGADEALNAALQIAVTKKNTQLFIELAAAVLKRSPHNFSMHFDFIARNDEFLASLFEELNQKDEFQAENQIIDDLQLDKNLEMTKQELERFKVKQCNNENYSEAVTAAERLIKDINLAKIKCYASKQNQQNKKEVLVDECTKSIDKSLCVLGKNREWKKFLMAFVLALTGVGIPVVIGMAATGFFQTNSAKKMDQFKEDLLPPKPAPSN